MVGVLYDPNKVKQDQQTGVVQTPDLGALMSAVSSPVQGLSAGQKDVMRSRLAAQGKTGLRNVLENLGSALGQSSPTFALNAARMSQGVGSNVAAKMADVDANQAEADRAATFQQRGQMLDLGSLLNQQFGIEKGAETSRYTTDTQVNLQRMLGTLSALTKIPSAGGKNYYADDYNAILRQLGAVGTLKRVNEGRRKGW